MQILYSHADNVAMTSIFAASQVVVGGVAGLSRTELHSRGICLRSSIPCLETTKLTSVAHSVANIHQTHGWGKSRQFWKKFPIYHVASTEMDAASVTEVFEKEKALKDDLAVKEEPAEPSMEEIKMLLMELCDETSIAQLNLKVGSLKIKVMRDIRKSKEPVPSTSVALSPPIPGMPMVESISKVSAPPVVKPSKLSALDFTPLSSMNKPMALFGLLEAAADEGLEFVTSPKVGLFRRGRVVKGKPGRALCEEGQAVKEGQVVCYLEQLGTQQPVEATISGEVVKILWEDGAPVGYADPLIAVRPSFVGIKKLN